MLTRKVIIIWVERNIKKSRTKSICNINTNYSMVLTVENGFPLLIE